MLFYEEKSLFFFPFYYYVFFMNLVVKVKDTKENSKEMLCIILINI